MNESAARAPLVVLDALLVTHKPTGVGRSILELLPELAAAGEGLRYLVLTIDRRLFACLDNHPGWAVRECPGARGGTLRKALFTQLMIPRICREEGASLLHSLQFVAPLKLPCASVVTVHDLAWLGFPDTVEEPRRSYYRFFVPRTLERAEAIVTNSQATAGDTLAFYPETRGRIHPTPFGTPSWVWRAPETRREKAEPPYFLFVGTLEPRKNLERLLLAYARFRALPAVKARPAGDVPILRFVGGRGWKASRLQDMIADLQAREWLDIMGYCEPSELWAMYRSAHGLLFPSLHEGFGFPILEAMAASLPVLTANRGAMLEVGGDQVLAVDPENLDEMAQGMADLAFDSHLRLKLARGGLGRAREFSWERTARATLQVYRRVLAGDCENK